LEKVQIAVAGIGFCGLIRAADVFGPILGRNPSGYAYASCRLNHSAGNYPRPQIENAPRRFDSWKDIVAVDIDLLGIGDAGLAVGAHLHGQDCGAQLKDLRKRSAAVRPDVLTRQPLNGRRHVSLYVVLPNPECEINSMIRCALRDVAKHLEVAVTLFATEPGDADLRELWQFDPVWIGWGQVIRLVGEHEIETVETVAGEHG